MYALSQFSLSDMTRFGIELRRLGADAVSMEEVANRIVTAVHQKLVIAPSNERACALVRTFVTLPYAQLPAEQQAFSATLFPDIASQPGVKCLTLLATAGEEAEWNQRTLSRGHQALPLPSEESLVRSPMISQLIHQLDVPVSSLLNADSSMLLDSHQRTFNVFHVANALGSPFIPAQQQFVVPYGIRSVIGFGGLLPPGELFATILFTKTPVSRDVAELFRTLALNVKVALLPFAGTKVFA
ncbi:MAG: hypothetical protein JWM95_4609 [Gemmatimonadetes bacterium]|nr:hypothetical protein [Gemmatimonadota bacterium]